jgi:hypothetical protein
MVMGSMFHDSFNLVILTKVMLVMLGVTVIMVIIVPLVTLMLRTLLHVESLTVSFGLAPLMSVFSGACLAECSKLIMTVSCISQFRSLQIDLMHMTSMNLRPGPRHQLMNASACLASLSASRRGIAEGSPRPSTGTS